MNYNEVDGITGASIMDTDWTELRSHDILDIFVDEKGFQWIGTDEALYYHDSEFVKNGWTRYHPGPLLSTFRVNNIQFDMDGKLLVATGEGLIFYDEMEWKIYTTQDGLTNNWINDIAIDDDNSYWLATNGGLSKLRFSTSLPNELLLHGSFSVFPTICESGQNLHISIGSTMRASLKVYNMTGILVYSSQLDNPNTCINTRSFETEKGYFILRIEQDNRLFVKRIFIY